MKTYPFPPPLAMVHDSEHERTEMVGALYGTTLEGKKIMIPELWLHGEWLQAAGFEIGDQVAIQIEEGKLTIYKLVL